MTISENVYQNILEQLTEGIYYVDTKRVITYWNKAAEHITGYSKEEVIGKSCGDNILRHIDEEGNDLCMDKCPLMDAVNASTISEKSIYLHHKNGHRVHIFTRVAPIKDDDGNITGAVELFTDLSKQNKCDLICELEKLKKEVYTDSLTMIGNRKYAEITLERRFSDLHDLGIPFGVFFIDIDNFKDINDTYGHDTGDRVLQMVAGSVQGLMRSLDVACRWGGEEFVVIIPNLTTKTIESIADRIGRFISASFLSLDDGTNLSVTVSTGVTLAQKDDTAETVIKRADQAMYQSKLDGRNRFSII